MKSIKKRSIDKTKRLFKLAMMKQPESIRSLKRSLSISNANIEAFANNIGEFTSIRITKEARFNTETHKSLMTQKSFSKNAEKQTNSLTNLLASRKQIVKQLNKNKFKDQRINNRQRNKILSKSFKFSQGKLNSGQKAFHTKTPLQCSEYEFVVPKSNEKSMRTTKRQYWNINQPKNKPLGSTKFKKMNESPKQNEKSGSKTQRFWCVTNEPANPAKATKYKTEPNEKSAQKSICYLTNYDSSRNNKAFHYLVLQLQLNLEVQKKIKSKAFN